MSRPDETRAVRRDLLLAAITAFGVFVLILPVARQGLRLLDDGVWLVGAEALLRGDLLYRDVFTIYGPAKFVVLALFFAIAGTSAATMALLEALTLGVAAGVGVFAVRRLGAARAAILVPLAVLALATVKTKIVAAGLFAIVFGLAWRGAPGPRAALGLGVFAGAATWFGFDTTVTVGITAVLVLALRGAWGERASTRVLVAGVSAFVLTAAVPLLWAAATGTTSEFLWDAFVYPIVHFRREMGVSMSDGIFDPTVVGQPFATLATGEGLDARWPWHGALRVISIWTLCALVFVAPFAGLFVAWKRRDALLASMASFAASSLVSLIARGDEQHLLGAALATTWLVATAVGRGPRPVAMTTGVVAILAFGPLLAETAWLFANASRESLRTWERPRAGIALATDRVASLESSFGAFDRVPTVFWPYQPGLNFVFDLPLGHPQITLLGGEVRDADALVGELRADPPPRVVLVQRFTLGGRTLRDLVPPLWGFLRTHYRIDDTVVGVADPAWVLSPVDPTRLTALPLDARLPDQRALVADETSPDLAAGATVGQTFEVADRDLSGLQVRWLANAIGFSARVELVVWSVRDGRPDRPLRGFLVDVDFDRRDRTSLFTFDPVEGTRGRSIAVQLRIPDGAPAPVRLLWHGHGGDGDLFSDGRALVDGEPVQADLYFAAY